MIEMCYYRFLDFAFHFIFFQIFQIDFSTECLMSSVSKYSIYDLRGQIAQFSIRTKAWKEGVEFCESFKYFPQELLRKYLKKKIFIILEVRIHHDGSLSLSLFSVFLSTR